MLSMKFIDNLKLYAARKLKVPGFTLLPNMFFNWFQGTRSPKSQQVLPKDPTVQQLRFFARNAIVRIPIEHIEDTISRLPIKITNVDPDDKRKYTKQKQQINKILRQPNLVQSWVPFVKMQLEDELTYGASAFQKCLGGANGLYLYPTDASTLQFVVPYDYQNEDAARYMQQQPNGMKYFSTKEVAYIQKNYFSDRPESLSPLRAAYDYIVYLLNAHDRADQVASNATADFLINLGEKITPTQRDEFRKYFEEDIQSTGVIPITSGSSDVSAVQIRALNKDSLAQDYMEFLRVIIGLAFKYPHQRMGIIRSGDRSTEAEIDNQILENCVKPWANVIEDALNQHIVQPLGYDGILKVSFVYNETEEQKTSRSKRITNEYIAGIIDRNTALTELGYPASDNEYAGLTVTEGKAKMNVDYNPNPPSEDNGGGSGGFNGLGTTKDNGDAIKEAST
jgi:hypothetical protein